MIFLKYPELIQYVADDTMPHRAKRKLNREDIRFPLHSTLRFESIPMCDFLIAWGAMMTAEVGSQRNPRLLSARNTTLFISTTTRFAKIPYLVLNILYF